MLWSTQNPWVRDPLVARRLWELLEVWMVFSRVKRGGAKTPGVTLLNYKARFNLKAWFRAWARTWHIVETH